MKGSNVRWKLKSTGRNKSIGNGKNVNKKHYHLIFLNFFKQIESKNNNCTVGFLPHIIINIWQQKHKNSV